MKLSLSKPPRPCRRGLAKPASAFTFRRSTMQISPVQLPSASPAAASKAAATPAQDLNNMFLQLLVAQLKAQSPLDPLDPNQFVAQLAQFNSLSELTQIRQILQQISTV